MTTYLISSGREETLLNPSLYAYHPARWVIYHISKYSLLLFSDYIVKYIMSIYCEYIVNILWKTWMHIEQK